MSKTGLLIVTVFLAASGLLYATVNRGATHASGVAPQPSDADRTHAAAPQRTGTSFVGQVAAAGKASDHRQFVAYPKPQKRYDRVDQLAADSSAIIVGIPLQAVGYKRSPLDRLVLTYYQVQVLEVLKGNVQKGKKVSLRVPGGYAMSNDGSSIETVMPGFWKNPTVGRGYVLFLKESKGQNGRAAPYNLLGGPQGSFEITPWPASFPMTKTFDFSTGRVVVPQVRQSDALMRAYNGVALDAFLRSVRLAANGM